MTQLERWQRYVGAAAMAMALGACGGGGGSGDSSSNGSVVAQQNPLPSTPPPAASEPGAPVLTNNIPADGMAWINYRRGQIGMSVLQRNTLIDAAAQGHSDYQKINETITHEQTIGKEGFTGVDTGDRLKRVGYPYRFAGEVISASSSSSGFYMAEELITAIYHRFAIFEPKFRDIGTGSATTAKGYTYFTTNFGTTTMIGGGLGGGILVHWPVSDQRMVPANFFSDNEQPDPVANLNEVGYPISVHADSGAVVNVNAFTLRQRGATADLNVKLLTRATDADTWTSVAAIVPLTVLRGNTVYDVTFRGTVDGVPADRTWSFTTR